MARHRCIDLKEQRISHAFPRAAGGLSAGAGAFADPRVHPPGTAEDGGAANAITTGFSRLISAWVTLWNAVRLNVDESGWTRLKVEAYVMFEHCNMFETYRNMMPTYADTYD